MRLRNQSSDPYHLLLLPRLFPDIFEDILLTQEFDKKFSEIVSVFEGQQPSVTNYARQGAKIRKVESDAETSNNSNGLFCLSLISDFLLNHQPIKNDGFKVKILKFVLRVSQNLGDCNFGRGRNNPTFDGRILAMDLGHCQLEGLLTQVSEMSGYLFKVSKQPPEGNSRSFVLALSSRYFVLVHRKRKKKYFFLVHRQRPTSRVF